MTEHCTRSLLLEERRRNELLLNSITGYAIYMLDAAGMVSTWNSGAALAKGYSENQILRRHFSLFYTPEDRENGEPEKALNTAVEFGRYEGDGWRVRRNG